MRDPPLPVAALMLRGRNAKSAKERHDLAYFGWEASVRLAVAAWPPADRARLAMPSTGDWVSSLADDDRIQDDAALLAVQRLLSEEGLGRAATPKTTTAARLLQGLPAYRNAILGHGAVRSQEFYERAGDVLAAGLDAVWRHAVLWPDDARLVCVESIEVDAAGKRRSRILDLSGAAPARVVDPRGTAVGDDVLPRRLYLEQAGSYRSLHPWLVFEAAELRERVLFFNGRGRAARYLDYVGGEQLKGKELVAAWPTIEADLDAAMLIGGGTDEPAEERDPARFGDYQLLGKLGEGGMGVVYLARQTSLGRVVALKMLPAGAGDDPVAVARFRREIAALARCEHPNVVKILAAGEVDGRRYYAMEVVDGADLSEVARALASGSDFDQAVTTASERVRKTRQDAFADLPAIKRPEIGEALPARRRDRVRALVELFRDAARALDHLHGQGILHRDVKPANLMVTADDHRVVLMDLGLAALGDASQSLTRDKGAILGTLRYLPPEQLQRSLLSLDRRADIYSLGATFYELLTGKPFFDGDTEVRLIEQVLRAVPVAPRLANPDLPKDLALILTKATEKDPKQRYDDAEALARDLDAYLDGRPITARPPSLGYLLRLAIRRHRAIAATVAVAMLLATAGAGWFLVRERTLRVSAEKARVDAEQARVDAESARDEVRASERRTNRALARSLVEQGRQMLLDHHPAGAAAYLAAAYPTLAGEPMVRSLVADAMRDIERSLATLVGHTGLVGAAAFSPDGRRILTGSQDRTARLWEATTGRPLATLEGHTDAVHSVAFSPDGQRVMTVSVDETVRLWDAATAMPPVVLEARAGYVYSAAFSPDGQRVVTTTDDGIVRLWDATTGEPLASLKGHTGPVWSAAFSPDGRYVVSAGEDGTARIWDPVTGKVQATLKGHTASVDSASFSPDGQRVATASGDGTARIWDRTTGKLLASLEGHTDRLMSALFSTDGQRLVTASEDHTARVWNAATGESLAILRGHTDSVWSAMFSPDGQQVVTTSLDRTARLWNAATGKPLATLDGHTEPVSVAVFSPDGQRVLTASWDGTARVWDSDAGTELTIQANYAGDASAAFSPDGRLVVTASDDHDPRIWDAATGRLRASLVGHTKDVRSVAFSPDGQHVLTASDDQSARIWDAGTGELSVTLAGHTDVVRSAAFSNDGQRVLTCSDDHTARLWEATTGTSLATLAGHSDVVWSAAFSPDGKLAVTASNDHSARIWDVATARQLASLEGPSAVVSAEFSPDGQRVVTASRDGVRIWDAATGEPIADLERRSTFSATFSSEGAHLVTATPTGARIWDAATASLIAPLEGHTGMLYTVAFSPDGQRLVTGGDSMTANVWDSASGTLLATLEGHTSAVFSATFSSDGQRIVTTSPDTTVRIWDVHLETRGPDEISAIVAAKVPWQIVDGKLLPRR